MFTWMGVGMCTDRHAERIVMWTQSGGAHGQARLADHKALGVTRIRSQGRRGENKELPVLSAACDLLHASEYG